jgi:hypothetical protein
MTSGVDWQTITIALKPKKRPSLAPLSVFALGMCLAAGMLPEASTER